MNRQKIFDALCRSVAEINLEMGSGIIEKAQESGIDEIDLIEQGIIRGLRQLSLYYEQGEAQTPDILIAVDVAGQLAGKILCKEPADLKPKRGVILIFSGKGDCHNIGRYILERLLNARSYKVYNIDDSPEPEKLFEIAQLLHVDVLVGSVILETSVSYAAQLREIIKEKESCISLVCGGSERTAKLLEASGIRYVSRTLRETVDLIGKLI
ncbi:MAG: cobalamin B12-binding domain-containing protein [Ruminococcus sp.]|jgi:methanogenic corrinoid protein MtbC1